MNRIVPIIAFAGLIAIAAIFGVTDGLHSIGGDGILKTAYTGESPFSLTKADQVTEEADAIQVATRDDGTLEPINAAGTYLLGGRYEGTVLIDAEDQNVHVILDGADIKSYDGPAIYAKSAGKLFITVRDDTENHLQDSAYYTDGEPNAAIYADCDLTINGNGLLAISGYHKDGIHARGELKVLDTIVSIEAKRCGIKANDGACLLPGILSIEAEKYGVQTVDSGGGNGAIELGNGTMSIVAGDTAIYSVSDLYIHDCSVAMQGVVRNIYAAGTQVIDEGCLIN